MSHLLRVKCVGVYQAWDVNLCVVSTLVSYVSKLDNGCIDR